MDDPSRAKQRAATPRLRLLESDPLQKIDFRKDANATAVEDMLNLTKEERRELETTARIDTPTDIAIKACMEDSHKLECKDALVVTKKVMSSLKQLKTSDKADGTIGGDS